MSPRAGVFVDRDGVICELVPDPRSGLPESPLDPTLVRLTPGAPAALARLRAAGFAMVCVTNQPGAAKGSVTQQLLLDINERVLELLAGEGVQLDLWRMCLHHPDGIVESLSGECDCRKPAPGLLLESSRELGLDIGRSWMVGDTDADVLAGRAAGCRTILIANPCSAHKRSGATVPDLVAADLGEAADAVLDDYRGQAPIGLSASR